MPRSNLPPDDAHELDGILRRLERIERRPQGTNGNRLRKLDDVADRPVLDDGDVPTWNGSKFAFTSAAGDSFWAYNAGTDTLAPDAATTTPLANFTVAATTTMSLTAPTVTAGATTQANLQAGTVGAGDFSRVRAATGSGAGTTIYANEGGNTADLTAVFFSTNPANGSACGLSMFIPAAGGAHGPMIEMGEVPAAPAAPVSNYGRIYMRDNGGKTQLVAQFPTGAVQVIATEP